MKARYWLLAIAAVALAAGLAWDWGRAEPATRTLWRQVVSPGALSASHAFVRNDCAACHTTVKGVQAAKCLSCHADDTMLLERLPTAFHAGLQTCAGCHIEHQGGARMPTIMDHRMLLKLGHRAAPQAAQAPLEPAAIDLLGRAFAKSPAPSSASPPARWTIGADATPRGLPAGHPRTGELNGLSCVTCHGTKDRHQRMFGSDCAQCHTADQWNIAAFRHPSARSFDCAQCHRPPPSHTMMHFSMVSARVARQPGASVNQCYACHLTTSWNDIRGVGFYKHH